MSSLVILVKEILFLPLMRQYESLHQRYFSANNLNNYREVGTIAFRERINHCIDAQGHPLITYEIQETRDNFKNVLRMNFNICEHIVQFKKKRRSPSDLETIFNLNKICAYRITSHPNMFSRVTNSLGNNFMGEIN